MEPYCADITNEEVRTLGELLKPPEDEAEHYKVGTLGHDRCEQEDLEVPQKPCIIFLPILCPTFCLPTHHPALSACSFYASSLPHPSGHHIRRHLLHEVLHCPHISMPSVLVYAFISFYQPLNTLLPPEGPFIFFLMMKIKQVPLKKM